MSKFLEFREAGTSKSGITMVWEVVPKSEGFGLGGIRWYGPWRKYVFNPVGDAVFCAACLRDIADFCELKTREHQQAAKGVKSS